MRPYQTLLLLALIICVGLYFYYRPKGSDPETERFVDCYVALAALHQYGDTAQTVYTQQKDSVMMQFGFSEESFLSFKQGLNRNPVTIVEVWEQIEKRLRTLQPVLEIKE